MRVLGTVFVALNLLALQAVVAASNPDTWRNRTTLTSYDLLAIERALPEVRRRRPSWSDYRISVIETDTSLLVSFWRPEDTGAITIARPQANGGSPEIIGSMPRAQNQLVVELDKKDLRIINVTNVGK